MMHKEGFIEFDEYLAEPFPVDHWEDDAIGYAQHLIARLAPADWEAFDSAWAMRPGSWQARAAQVLSNGLPMYAVPILVRMAESEDLDVVEAAVDSLRDFGSPEAPLAVPSALIQRLDRLTAERPGPVARVVADLRRRIRAV
jgi:HEAT repeat protein